MPAPSAPETPQVRCSLAQFKCHTSSLHILAPFAKRNDLGGETRNMLRGMIVMCYSAASWLNAATALRDQAMSVVLPAIRERPNAWLEERFLIRDEPITSGLPPHPNGRPLRPYSANRVCRHGKCSEIVAEDPLCYAARL